MIWTQGFIKGWALGKLTSCDNNFARLVWSSIRAFFLPVQWDSVLWKPVAVLLKMLTKPCMEHLNYNWVFCTVSLFKDKQIWLTSKSDLHLSIDINYFQTFLWSQKLNWKCAKSHCGEWNNGCPEISVIHNNYFTSMHWIWVYKQSIQHQVGHNHLLSHI